MNDFAGHAAGFKQFQDRLGSDCPVFTWNNQDFPIVPGTGKRRKDLGPGGYLLTADLKLTVLLSELPTIGPALKQTIVYLGDEYRIDSINTHPGELMVTFECNDANAAA